MSGHSGQEESKYYIGQNIAVQAGAIKQCEYHPEIYLDAADEEARLAAHDIASDLIARGDPEVSPFNGDRDALIELIDRAINDAGAPCSLCSPGDEL